MSFYKTSRIKKFKTKNYLTDYVFDNLCDRLGEEKRNIGDNNLQIRKHSKIKVLAPSFSHSSIFLLGPIYEGLTKSFH